MKITLINPPSPYLLNDAAYPPSGLMYLAAAIEREGHKAEISDLTGGGDWRSAVKALRADAFGITVVTPNVPLVKEITSLLPAGAPVILGGVHPTFLPDDVQENMSCDCIVKGEAEVVIADVLRDLVAGTLRRVYEGGLVPVEAITKPARHLVDLHKYRPGGEAATPIYSSRGCPFNCSFCSKVTGRVYRDIPIERVVEEIEEVKALGFDNILFGDDDIAIKPRRLRDLLRAVKGLGIRFRLNQDARHIDEEAVALAKEAGCYEISFGIESGSQRMLDLMNKQARVEANEKAILTTKKYGMNAKAYFLVNFPGENEESVEETLRFARRVRPDKWLVSAFAPLPGSDTFANPGRYGIVWMSRNWEDYYLIGRGGTFKPCFRTDDMSFERQIFLHDKLVNGLNEALG